MNVKHTLFLSGSILIASGGITRAILGCMFIHLSVYMAWKESQ